MRKTLVSILLLAVVINLYAQNVTITPGGITPANTHLRLSYDSLLALPDPKEGDLIYDTTFKCLRVYTNNKWICSHQTFYDLIPNISALATAGGSGEELGRDIAVDGNGNVYIVGAYANSVSFGGTVITAAGSSDIFVAKYNNSGILQWVRSAGGIYDDQGYSIAVDASGNAFITGHFRESVQFGTTSLVSAGNSDIFIVKYDTNGVVLWAEAEGGIYGDQAVGLTVDQLGNCYVTGTYYKDAVFSSVTLPSYSNISFFIAKYNAAGTLQWIQSAGSSLGVEGVAIAVDTTGNVYVTGNFASTVYFGATPVFSKGAYDIFITKLDSAGNFQWVKSLGGESYDYADDIVVDKNGNFFVIGTFIGTASFEGWSKTSVGYFDMFVIKFTNYANLQWIQTAGGSSDDHGKSIAVDNEGSAYITGYYSMITTFNHIAKIANGGYDLFISKYDKNGTLQWVLTPKGDSIDFGFGIALNAAGNIFSTGYFQGTILFGNSTKTSAGGKDIFIMRIDN